MGGDGQAGDGLEVALRQVVAQRALDLVDVDVAVHAPTGVVLGGDDVVEVVVVFVGQLTDHLLGHVLQRQHAGESAELVDHRRQLGPLAGELGQRVGQRHEGGQDHGRAHEVGDGDVRARAGSGVVAQQVRQLDHPERLVVLGDHRVAGVADGHEFPDLGGGDVGGDGRGLQAGDHGVLDGAVGEIDDPVDKHRQLLGQFAARAGVGDDAFQIRGRGRRVQVLGRLDPHQPQQAVGGTVEHDDEPAEHRQVDAGRAGEGAGQRLGRRDREVLGVQLAEDHLHDRCHRQRQHGADADAHRRGHPDHPEQFAERFADHRLGHEAHEQTGDRDTQLRAGEHERGAFGDLEDTPRGGVTRLGLRGHAVAVDRHVRELLGHEVAVGRDDHQDRHDPRQEHQNRREHGELERNRPGPDAHRCSVGDGPGAVCRRRRAAQRAKRAIASATSLNLTSAASSPSITALWTQ